MRHLLPVVLLLAACEPPPPPVPGELERTGEVLSVVNGQNITQGMMDAQLAQLPAQVKDQMIARGQMGQMKEQLIIGEVLYQEALKRKLHEDPAMKTKLAIAERSALANGLLEQIVTERTTDEAVKKWYDEHAVQFVRPQVKARHVLVKDKAEADQILADLKGGADFATVAKAKSQDAGSGKEGGDLGWFEKGRMVPEFADAAFAAEKGALIGPVQTKFGFHVILIDDKREAIPLEEAAEKIKSQLRNEVAQAYIEEVRKGATITTPGEAAAGGATVAPAAGGDAKPAQPKPATP